MTTEPVEIYYSIAVGLAPASHKGVIRIDRGLWDGMTPDERIAFVDGCYRWSVGNGAAIDDPVTAP